MTVNCHAEDPEKRIAADTAFLTSLIGSKVCKTDKIASDREYPHGFLVLFFENGGLARYSYTCSPLPERTEISAFAPSANVYADSEKKIAVTKTGELFDDDKKITLG